MTSNEATPEPPKKKRRRGLKIGLPIVAILIAGAGLWTWASLGFVYSSGERTGYVKDLAQRGWLCKTWEGQLVVSPIPTSTVASTTAPTTAPTAAPGAIAGATTGVTPAATQTPALGDSTAPGAGVFNFTIRNDSVARALQLADGKPVTLSYGEHKGVPTTCFGESKYFVQGFRVAQ